MWLRSGSKALVCLVILMTSGHLSPTASPLETDTTFSTPLGVNEIGSDHVTESDFVTLTTTFDQNAQEEEADDKQNNEQVGEKESSTQTKSENAFATQQASSQKDLGNYIKSTQAVTNTIITNSVATNLRDASNEISSMDDKESYSGMVHGTTIKNGDFDIEEAADRGKDRKAINGRLNAVLNKATMKDLGNEIRDDVYDKDKSAYSVTEDSSYSRGSSLGSDVTTTIKVKGLPEVTKYASDVSNKHDTEAPPPMSFVMTENTWTDGAKVASDVVIPAGRIFKAQLAEGTRRTLEAAMSTPSASPINFVAGQSQESPPDQVKASELTGRQKPNEAKTVPVNHRGNQTASEGPNNSSESKSQSNMKCQNAEGCQSETATPGESKVIPDEAKDISEGSLMHDTDSALTLTTDIAPQSAANERSELARGRGDNSQDHIMSTDAPTDSPPTDAPTDVATEVSSDAGQPMAVASTPSQSGPPEDEGEAGNFTRVSHTQAPTKRSETDYVSIEEARSLTNDTDEVEMPSIAKLYFPEKSTSRPNKDLSESSYSSAPMSSSHILSTQSSPKQTTVDDKSILQEIDNSTQKEPLMTGSNDSVSFTNRTVKHRDTIDTTKSTNISVSSYPYDYGQDYDYLDEEEADQIKNVTVEYQSVPPEATNRKYNRNRNRTKQRVGLDASLTTDNDVTQMSRAEVTSATDHSDHHRPLSMNNEKKPGHFKPQPHISSHRKRVYPPHAFHGLIWEDRRYLVSVLVPVGCGVAGALVIVCLAYAARSCQSRREKKPTPAPQLTAADIAYMDKLMLLAESSDEDV